MTSCCEVDDTWEDCQTEFRSAFSCSDARWRCYLCDGVDKEAILSASEVMDAKTDPGCGYSTVSSLKGLLSSGEIPSSAVLKGDALLDVMDIIHARELLYLQGLSLTAGCLSFPYFLHMNLLQDQNPTLHAYCSGVVRSVELVMRAVFSTNIRSDEEFVAYPKELDRNLDISEEQILSELEEAACKAESPAIAARLRWRKHFLSALKLFIEGTRRSDVEAASSICQEACDLLDSADYMRAAEPVEDPRFFREEVAYWTSSITPTKVMPCPPFAKAMQEYRVMLGQLASLHNLQQLPTLQCVFEFVEDLGAQQPLLIVRALAVIVLFSHNPFESFLYGHSLPHRILEELAVEHGAPLYLKIFEGDEELLEGVVKYRIQKTKDPLKVTPQEVQLIRQGTIESVRHWAVEVSRVYLFHMEAMLCNRGLAHRRLMNAMPQLGNIQELSYFTDSSIFLSHTPSVSPELESEALRRLPVLSVYANKHILRAVGLLFSLAMELNIFTEGEIIPALWYLNFAERAQLENFGMLGIPSGVNFPETRINRRTKVPLHNLALTTRTAGQADTVRYFLLETGRMIADAVFIAACVMEGKGLIDLTSGAKHSHTTVENIFNHRVKCLRHIRSHPFTPYDRCIASKPVMDSEHVSRYAQKAGEIAVSAADRLKQLLMARELNPLRKKALQSQVVAMEKTARAIGASLAHFAALCDDEAALKNYTVTIERPFKASMISLSFHEKTNKKTTTATETSSK